MADHTSPVPSPRRTTFAFNPTPPTTTVSSSPRPHKGVLGARLPSFSSATQALEDARAYSPSLGHAALSPVAEGGRSLLLNTAMRYPLLSPQLTTPVDGRLEYPYPPESSNSPRPGTSPRLTQYELPPRSRRNSAAIVSISLSSRSRSRTPRGAPAALPNTSGNATPSKSTEKTAPPAAADVWAPGVEELDEWAPAGGMLLDDDDEAVEDDWSDRSDTTPKDVLQPGMIFGEGLEFQGEVIVAAVGKNGNGYGDLALRRGGSEAGQPRREISQSGRERIVGTERKRYEVVRQLGSGSYAVVYLVREKGGRKREYGESAHVLD